jgi:mono/diheme cytochrome c family protein
MSRRISLVVWIIGALAAIAPLLYGCGAERRGQPEAPAIRPDNPREVRGERLFHRWCYQCHPGGEAGLGPAINDRPLPHGAIRLQIRKGVGAMPAFGDDLLSDRDVTAILAYLDEMKASPARAR